MRKTKTASLFPKVRALGYPRGQNQPRNLGRLLLIRRGLTMRNWNKFRISNGVGAGEEWNVRGTQRPWESW